MRATTPAELAAEARRAACAAARDRSDEDIALDAAVEALLDELDIEEQKP